MGGPRKVMRGGRRARDIACREISWTFAVLYPVGTRASCVVSMMSRARHPSQQSGFCAPSQPVTTGEMPFMHFDLPRQGEVFMHFDPSGSG